MLNTEDAIMLTQKIHVLLVWLLILLFLSSQGCAAPTAKSPQGENAFLNGMRETVREAIDITRITACEVVSDDCPDLQRNGRLSSDSSG